MSGYTDLTVRTRNPELLDQTVQQLGLAVVVNGSWNGDTCQVRVFGDPGFIRFAITNQGYGEVLDEACVKGPDLNAAVERIREVAGNATEGPWRTGHGSINSWVEQACDDGHQVAELGPCHDNLHPDRRVEDSEHMALWDPIVAGLVAELLETIGRLRQPNRIDVIQVGVVARELAEAIDCRSSERSGTGA